MMAGPVTRRSERKSNDQLIEDSVNNKELDLFSKLADAIGDTLEAVCNMQERERSELITVLGLTGNDDSNVKILMLSGEEQSGTSNNTPNHSRQNSHTDSSDRQMNNNGSKELDDDLEVVAIRKRKRSTSSDTSRECKRVLATSNSNGSKRADFSKYLASKNGNIANSPDKANSEFASQESGEKDETVDSSDIVKLNRVSVDISGFDFIKEIETENRIEPSRSTDNEISLDDEDSLSLLGEKVSAKTKVENSGRNSYSSNSSTIGIKNSKVISKDTLLTDKEIEDLLDGSDDEASSKHVSEETSEELLGGKDDTYDHDDIIDQKLAESLKIVVPMCIKDKVKGKWLNGLLEKRICDPNSIFKLDCLPIVSSKCFEKYKVEKGCSDGRKILSTYYTELNKIKSKGLVHGLTGYEPPWTKLPMSKNSRGKGEGKEIDLKFVETPKRFASNRIIDDGSSDEFESEKDSFCKAREKKEESDFDSVKRMIKPSQCTTPKQKQDGAWMCKPSSSIRPDTSPHVNRLKLPKKKMYTALVTPEKSKLEPRLIPSPNSAGISLQNDKVSQLTSGQGSPFGREVRTIGDIEVLRRKAQTVSDIDANESDDDSIEIVLEVGSKENTPTKQIMKQTPSVSVPASDSPSTSYNSQPIEADETPTTGSCPLCGKVMSMAQLERHCSSCMGPDEGPRLRNTGLKGRKTY